MKGDWVSRLLSLLAQIQGRPQHKRENLLAQLIFILPFFFVSRVFRFESLAGSQPVAFGMFP